MGNFNGAMGKGYMRTLRKIKRIDAEIRQSRPVACVRTKRHRKLAKTFGSCPDCRVTK